MSAAMYAARCDSTFPPVLAAARARRHGPTSLTWSALTRERNGQQNGTETSKFLLNPYGRSLSGLSLLRRPPAFLAVLPSYLADPLNTKPFETYSVAASAHQACCFAC